MCDTGNVRLFLSDPEGQGGRPRVSGAVLLACGNALRQDDGVGLRIAEAAEQLFPASRLRIVAVQQWMPELAAELAAAELAIFVDASVADEPGAIRVRPVGAAACGKDPHTVDPATLLSMAREIRGHAPGRAFVLTVGAGELGYAEQLSGRVRQAVPRAVRLVGNLVEAFTAA